MISLPLTTGECQPNGLSFYYKWQYFPGIFSGGLAPPPRMSLSILDPLVKAATTQCLLNLKRQKVNLGVSLAEAKEVAELIGNTARRVGNLYQSAYNRNPKDWLAGVRNAGRNYKKVPSYYLEYVYGVKPLLSDIDGAAQQLAESFNRGNSPVVTAYGVRKDSSAFNRSLSSGVQFGEYVCDGSEERIARVGVAAEAPNWVMQDYSSLGVTNPFSVAWEKVPYSHVVDWMLPIGDWVNTWDVSNYLHFKSGFTTRFMSRTGQIQCIAPSGAKRWSLAINRQGRLRMWEMSRTPMVSFPSASFPSLRNPLSLDHMAQGLAMLSQVIGGHKRLARAGPR